MKVLYVGHYRDHTGYGDAAIRNILALDAAGVDVVCRSIRFNNSNLPLPKRILELEQKSEYGANICIQSTLPSYIEYDGHFDKNIVCYYNETDSFCDSGWETKINCMDSAWVACPAMERAARKSGVKIPIDIIPITCDTTLYEEEYEPLDIPQVNGNFIFYWIGELIHRKNLTAAMVAFHLEFSPSEPVSFIIKANKSGLSAEQCLNEVQNLSKATKENLRLYGSVDDYAKEIVITKRLSVEEMMRLHATCHCFLMTGYGAGWNMPAVDAMGIGNTVIANETGLFEDIGYFNFPAITVPGQPEPVIDNPGIPGLHTANETWKRIDITKLRKAMRNEFNASLEYRQEKANRGLDLMYDFSYETIGQKMKGLLEQ